MVGKVLLICSLIGITFALPNPSPQGYDLPSPSPSYDYKPPTTAAPTEPPKYTFEWDVKDSESGNDFGQNEMRDGDKTEGTYFVLLPDGRKQIVKYQVDGDSGLIVDVSYEEGEQNGYSVPEPKPDNKYGPPPPVEPIYAPPPKPTYAPPPKPTHAPLPPPTYAPPPPPTYAPPPPPTYAPPPPPTYAPPPPPTYAPPPKPTYAPPPKPTYAPPPPPTYAPPPPPSKPDTSYGPPPPNTYFG